MVWFTYELHPIQWGLDHLQTVESTAAQIALRERNDPDLVGSSRQFDLDFERAKDLARQASWEGDFARGPYVMWLPPCLERLEMRRAFVWQQQNNGTCFVVSHYPMPWLGCPQPTGTLAAEQSGGAGADDLAAIIAEEETAGLLSALIRSRRSA